MDRVLNDSIERFLSRVSSTHDVAEAYLFGSRARGDHAAESDADLAIVLKDESGSLIDTKLAFGDVAYDVMLETGLLIEPLPIWQNEWADPDHHRNPALLRGIRRDGLAIWPTPRKQAS